MNKTISPRKFIRITGFLQNIWTLLVCITWGVWWGGLTFYAVVVVPIGASDFGSVEQGFVTQRVTIAHNWLSVLLILCLIFESFNRSSRYLFGLGIALSILILRVVSEAQSPFEHDELSREIGASVVLSGARNLSLDDCCSMDNRTAHFAVAGAKIQLAYTNLNERKFYRRCVFQDDLE